VNDTVFKGGLLHWGGVHGRRDRGAGVAVGRKPVDVCTGVYRLGKRLAMRSFAAVVQAAGIAASGVSAVSTTAGR